MNNFVLEDGLVHYKNLIFQVEPHKYGDCARCQCNQLLQNPKFRHNCMSPEKGKTWCRYLVGRVSKLTLVFPETVIKF